LIDISGNILKINGITIGLFGYNIEEEKLNVCNLIDPEDVEYGTKSFLTLKQEGLFTNYRTKVLTKNKKVKWVQINGNLVVN
jgi:PAS domain-containing protein